MSKIASGRRVNYWFQQKLLVVILLIMWYHKCDIVLINVCIMDNKQAPFHGVFTTFVTTAAVVVWLQVQNWKQWEHVDDGGNVLTTRSVAMIWSNEFLTNI